MEQFGWTHAADSEQIVPPGAEILVDPVGRLREVLDPRALTFATSRFGGTDGIDFRLGRRGLVADEAAAFLRALDAGLLDMDDTGGVRVVGCHPKPGGGRYSLFSANRYGGDLYVSLNVEYLIQLGASCELVAFHGWVADEIEVEVGQFDALGRRDGRVVLAMEAKARVNGPDSLTGLWHAFTNMASSDHPPDPVDNHSRKYVELLRLAESGPVVLWLVAAGARWVALAKRVSSHIEYEPIDGVEPRHLPHAGGVVVSDPGRQLALEPSVDHARAVAALTESDGQQRTYEFPWSDETELALFLQTLGRTLRSAELLHARPWSWRASSSTGSPMTPSGRSTGLELRFSYYA